MEINATVKEVVQETPRVRLVRLVWPGVSDFVFKPGQWISVHCDDFLGPDGKPLRRAFSIASRPGMPYLELCITRGEGLSAHLQDLSPGAVVHVDGPYGLFCLHPSKKYLFIAGGSGIAPFRPMIYQALAEKKDVLFIFSIKTPSDFIYRTELEELKKNPKFKMIVTITVDQFPQWDGERGRIQDFLQKYCKPAFDAYVCGPPGMVDAVLAKLTELKHPAEKTFVDRWQ